MRSYSYEIRRFALHRLDGASPHGSPIYLTAPGDAGHVVDRGEIDHATPSQHEAITRQLARLAAEHGQAGPARFLVVWQRSPRGPHARLFRGMQCDAVPAED